MEQEIFIIFKFWCRFFKNPELISLKFDDNNQIQVFIFLPDKDVLQLKKVILKKILFLMMIYHQIKIFYLVDHC